MANAMDSRGPNTTLVLSASFEAMAACALDKLTRWSEDHPLALSRCLVVVPTAAATHLFRSQLEAALPRTGSVVLLPFITTPGALIEEWLRRSDRLHRIADPILREAILEDAFAAAASDTPPPFRAQGGLARRALQFYDELRLNGFEMGGFVERALEELEAPDDEGAQKMAAQTRFLHASIEGYEQKLSASSHLDPVSARAVLAEERFPFRRAVVLGGGTLSPLDGHLLEHAKGLEELSFIAVGELAELPEWMKRFAPSAQTFPGTGRPLPDLLTPEPLVARDREESLVDAVRFIRSSGVHPDRVALVVPQPLPYLYLAKKVLSEASISFQLHDTFPLAAEPYLAAFDLALELVATDGHRDAALALLRSPFFAFPGVGPVEVAAFDALTLRYHERGSTKRWASLHERKSRPELQPALPGMERADAAQRVLDPIAAIIDALRILSPLKGDAPITAKTACLRLFLQSFGAKLHGHRHERAKAAVDTILLRFDEAARLLGDEDVPADTFRDKLRRAFEAHTFEERTGTGGVHVVEARTAGFGAFDLVVLMGVNEGEWPARVERNIFYPQWLLREFGWPSDFHTLVTERARFDQLLQLSENLVALLRHQLEDEVPTVASPLLEDVEKRFGSRTTAAQRVTDPHALRDTVVTRSEALRRGLLPADEPVPHPRPSPGEIGKPPPVPEPLSPTSLELYLRCPFKYFSRYLLKIDEEEDVSESLTPLERGRILHDVLEVGFKEWDRGGDGRPRRIDPSSYDEAASLFRDIAARMIPREHRSIELSRLFGGPGERGAIEWLLRWELTKPGLSRRLLEYGFQTPLKLERGPSGEAPWFVRIKGRIDRAEIDERGHLHVFDYKSGRPPEPKVTLQVPLYAMCLSQELAAPVGDAAYLSFAEKRSISRTAFDDASARLIDTYRSIEEGRFPPRPHKDNLCNSCGFIGVCRREIQDVPESLDASKPRDPDAVKP